MFTCHDIMTTQGTARGKALGLLRCGFTIVEIADLMDTTAAKVQGYIYGKSK